MSLFASIPPDTPSYFMYHRRAHSVTNRLLAAEMIFGGKTSGSQ